MRGQQRGTKMTILAWGNLRRIASAEAGTAATAFN